MFNQPVTRSQLAAATAQGADVGRTLREAPLSSRFVLSDPALARWFIEPYLARCKSELEQHAFRAGMLSELQKGGQL